MTLIRNLYLFDIRMTIFNWFLFLNFSDWKVEFCEFDNKKIKIRFTKDRINNINNSLFWHNKNQPNKSNNHSKIVEFKFVKKTFIFFAADSELNELFNVVVTWELLYNKPKAFAIQSQ